MVMQNTISALKWHSKLIENILLTLLIFTYKNRIFANSFEKKRNHLIELSCQESVI